MVEQVEIFSGRPREAKEKANQWLKKNFDKIHIIAREIALTPMMYGGVDLTHGTELVITYFYTPKN